MHGSNIRSERKTVLLLSKYRPNNYFVKVLICTATLAWGVNFPAHLVVIKGTEYFDGKQKRYVDMPITDVLQMMGRAGRPQVSWCACDHVCVRERACVWSVVLFYNRWNNTYDSGPYKTVKTVN